MFLVRLIWWFKRKAKIDGTIIEPVLCISFNDKITSVKIFYPCVTMTCFFNWKLLKVIYKKQWWYKMSDEWKFDLKTLKNFFMYIVVLKIMCIFQKYRKLNKFKIIFHFLAEDQFFCDRYLFWSNKSDNFSLRQRIPASPGHPSCSRDLMRPLWM